MGYWYKCLYCHDMEKYTRSQFWRSRLILSLWCVPRIKNVAKSRYNLIFSQSQTIIGKAQHTKRGIKILLKANVTKYIQSQTINSETQYMYCICFQQFWLGRLPEAMQINKLTKFLLYNWEWETTTVKINCDSKFQLFLKRNSFLFVYIIFCVLSDQGSDVYETLNWVL